MEISIRLILVAMVGVVTATIVIAMLTGEASGFGDFLDTQSKTSECKLLQQQGKQGGDRWNELGCTEVLDLQSSAGTTSGVPRSDPGS